MKKFLIPLSLLLIIFGFSPAFAYEDDLDGLLKDHVKPVTARGIQYNGVNYNSWRKDPRHATVRNVILATDPTSLTSKNEKLAYWINAYNVLTIDLITRENEQKTIKNLKSGFTSPWEKYKWNIAGKDYTLDQIEHDIIRPLGEPRIHFAINCAAKSCPDLRTEAYRADKLDSQLEDQTKKTFKNVTKGYEEKNGNIIRVTKVMDWFKKDFGNGNLNSWLQSYLPDTVNDQTRIKFFNYDWCLNKQ